MRGETVKLTFLSAFLVAAICFLVAIHDEFVAEYPYTRQSEQVSGLVSRRRDLVAEDDCDQIPMANIESTWDWARKRRITIGATGMMVYQNGNKLFEQYEPSNVCPIFCMIPPIRYVWNLFNQFGGSPDKRLSLYSGTKSAAGLAALMLVKQNYIGSLDDKVSEYIEEWKGDKNKEDITIRGLLTLSSGIRSLPLPFMSIQAAIRAPFVWETWTYGIEPFLIFGHIIQLRTGRSGWQYLDDEVFSELDMALPIGSMFTSGVTNFYTAGAVTLPDLYKLAEEILAAAEGNGKLFNEQDVEELKTHGIAENYGLTFWLGPQFGTPSSCDPSEPESVALNIIGHFGQVATIFPKKRLIVIKSTGPNPFNLMNVFDFWSRLFDGVDCACTS